MRITCPNCAAQYEVDDALIPEAGRDVQCSNCGKGWFQTKAAAPSVERPEPPPEPPSEPPAQIDPEPQPSIAEPEPSEEPEAPAETPGASGGARAGRVALLDENDLPPDFKPTQDSPGFAPPPQPPRTRRIDETVLSVLREEAEREVAARRAAGAPLESQPELGLPEEPQRRPVRGTAPEAAAVAPGGRRDRLPDIDELNSTLRSNSDRTAEPAAPADEPEMIERRRRGFRLGFGLMLLVAAALIALYVGADWLAAAVPDLAPLIASYVDWANGVRIWLDGVLNAGVEAISVLMAPDASTAP